MIRHPKHGSTAAAFLLLAIVALGPLPFGSVMPRERLGLELAGLIALVLVLAEQRDLGTLRGVARPALAIAAVGAFGLLQSLSWPRPVTALLAPRIAEPWRETFSLLGESADSWVPLSLAPGVSRETALQWLAVAACMAAASAVGENRRRRRLLAVGLLAAAVFEVAYGADHWFQRQSTIWGLEVPGDRERLRGTFVNPDHFALFLLLPLVAAFAWVWWSMRRALRSGSLERRLLHITVPWLVFLMLFVGLAFTGSRGAMVSALVAILAQALLLAFYHRKWQASLLGLGAVVVGLLGVLYFGLQQGLGRWMATSAYEITWNTRLKVYGAAWELWRQCPWTGTGLGTFRQAFPSVQPPELDQTWIHAHSDLLEMLVTTGLVGLPVLGYGLVALGRQLVHALRKGRRSEDRAAALAALGALAAVLSHSVVDFALTQPANAFLVAIVLGAACGIPIRPRPAEPKHASSRRFHADEHRPKA
ncbi:MAG: O-antigen ligase family protein [bacterium]|nr:O-antigen ligase family protein [bacterium]